jgi:hypothetical protein
MQRRLKRFIKIFAVIAAIVLSADYFFFQSSGYPPPHLKVPELFSPARPIVPDTAALIVNGAISPRKNHARYWNNTSLMYATCKAWGFEHIAVLQSDGISPAPDHQARSFLGMFGTGDLIDSPRDLDGDRSDDISADATLASLERSLSDLGSRMKPGSRLVLFFTDHGQLRLDGGKLTSVAMLWGGGELRGKELDRLLRKCVPETCWVAVIATQCHSKLFLDEVTRPRTLLVASGRPLWIWSTQDYSVFPYHLCGAMLGRDPATGAALAEGSSKNLRAAVRAASARDHTPEWPIAWIVGDSATIPDPF